MSFFHIKENKHRVAFDIKTFGKVVYYPSKLSYCSKLRTEKGQEQNEILRLRRIIKNVIS